MKVTFLTGHFLLVVLEGLEPSQAEPESDVLPLHHRTILKCDAKVMHFFDVASKNAKFFQIICNFVVL